MTNCNQKSFQFQALNRRKIETEFSGGDISSDEGVLLLRQIDKKMSLMESVNNVLHDPRDSKQITYSQFSLLRQRIYDLWGHYLN